MREVGPPLGVTFGASGVTADFGSGGLRDRSGQAVLLRPQAFAVLTYLTENANRLVTKDELMAAVWPGISVTDDSLVQCVHEIRRAIGDETHAILKTAPKRGYRLDLPAQAAAPAPHSPARRGALAALGVAVALVAALLVWWNPHGGVAPAGAEAPVVAVLPFQNLGGDPEQVYFADGITDDLITDLSKISGILVIARNSVWHYRDRSVDVRQVAAGLGARYVLEGSVRREGGRVRINAQLIDAHAGHHVWADRYDGTLGDVLALQDKVIGSIVAALAIELTSAEAATAGVLETANPLAYDALLRGRDLLRRDSEAETLEAIAEFERAIDLDPDYGQAHAALAAAQWRIVLSYWSSTAGAGWQHAYEALLKSLAESRKRPSALAYAVSAQLLSQQGRYDEAFADVERAMALAPGDPDNHVARASILNATGRAIDAEAEVRAAMRADPQFAPASLRVLAISLFNQGKYAEAAETLERVTSQGSDVAVDYATLISALGHLGRFDAVPALIERYNALAIPAAYDPLTVQESAWDWYGIAFDYHRPYVLKMQEGLRKAGIPEGAGTDLAYDDYIRFVTRHAGEFDVAGTTKIDARAAKALRDRGVPFVDARAHFDYDNGHVPGARNLSLAVDLSRDTLAQVVGPDDEVTFYCHGKYCPVSAFASAKAVAWGYRRVYHFAGGFPEWQDAGYPIEETSGR
jgi:adenylate cyclase